MGSGGHSTIVPYEYETIKSLDENGNTIVSATFNMVDNRPDLDWASLDIEVSFGRTLCRIIF